MKSKRKITKFAECANDQVADMDKVDKTDSDTDDAPAEISFKYQTRQQELANKNIQFAIQARGKRLREIRRNKQNTRLEQQKNIGDSDEKEEQMESNQESDNDEESISSEKNICDDENKGLLESNQESDNDEELLSSEVNDKVKTEEDENGEFKMNGRPLHVSKFLKLVGNIDVNSSDDENAHNCSDSAGEDTSDDGTNDEQHDGQNESDEGYHGSEEHNQQQQQQQNENQSVLLGLGETANLSDDQLLQAYPLCDADGNLISVTPKRWQRGGRRRRRRILPDDAPARNVHLMLSNVYVAGKSGSASDVAKAMSSAFIESRLNLPVSQPPTLAGVTMKRLIAGLNEQRAVQNWAQRVRRMPNEQLNSCRAKQRVRAAAIRRSR